MQKLTVVLVVLVAAVALAESSRVRREDEEYTTKYDNINIDDILGNDRLLGNYVKCLLDEGPCTPEGAELKNHVTDALEHDCEKCSEKQKEGALKVVKFLKNNKPEVWEQLRTKYDPEGKYEKKYEAKLKA